MQFKEGEYVLYITNTGIAHKTRIIDLLTLHGTSYATINRIHSMGITLARLDNLRKAV